MLLRAATFTHRCCYTGMVLHKGAFAHRHAGAYTHRCLYIAILLHRGAFTHMCFYTGSLSTQSILCTEKLLHKYSYADFLVWKYIIQRCFENTDHPQILLQRGVLHGYFYTEVLLHTGAFRTRTLLGRGTFAWVRLDKRFTGGFKPFWTEAAIQPHLSAYTQIRLLQGDAFTHKFSYTGPSHRDGLKKKDFTKGRFYTQVLLHRDAFNTDACTHRCLRRQILLHGDDFAKRKF